MKKKQKKTTAIALIAEILVERNTIKRKIVHVCKF